MDSYKIAEEITFMPQYNTLSSNAKLKVYDKWLDLKDDKATKEDLLEIIKQNAR